MTTPLTAEIDRLRVKPLAIDLYCGLGGWTEGLLAEGYDVIGFDIERHRYPVYSGKGTEGTKVSGLAPGKFPPGGLAQGAIDKVGRTAEQIGWQEYPAQLVLQDALTLHGSQFRDAALIVASPPCQEFSYMAMPWSRAKAIAAEYRSGVRDVKKLTALFDTCFRIQREAIEAAGHFIPLVVENVRGAQKWVGRSRWNYGSFHLWGDVPALMPMTKARKVLNKYSGNGSWVSDTGADWRDPSNVPGVCTHMAARELSEGQKTVVLIEGQKTIGHANIRDGHSHTRHLTNQAESDGLKVPGIKLSEVGFNVAAAQRYRAEQGIKDGGDCFDDPAYHGKAGGAKNGIKSDSRKAASAAIAKIPLMLARHIARTFKPPEC